MIIKKNIMICSVIIEVIFVCLYILLGNFNNVGVFVPSSAGIIFGYTLPCLLYARIYGDRRYKAIAICGTVIAFAAVIISVLALWGIIHTNISFVKTIGILNVIIWTLAIISWILSYTTMGKSFTVFRLVFIISLLLSSMCTSAIIYAGDIPSGILLRLCLLLLAITIGSFVCILILIKTHKKYAIKAETVKE